MNTRSNPDMSERAEIPSNRDGFGELRQAIGNAHASGNLVLLGELQAKYRREVRVYRESARGRTAHASQPVAHTRSVVRAPEREIAGVLLNFSPQPTVMENGEVVMLDVTPESLRGWLRDTDPTDVPLVVEHETAPCGHFLRFQPCNAYMEGDPVPQGPGEGWRIMPYIETVAVVDDSPAGHLCLRGVDDGTLPGFSFKGHIVRSHDTGLVKRGLPLIECDELEILEAGPCLDPADKGAVITLVRGKQPRWQQAQAAVEAAEQLRAMRPSPSRRGGPAQAWRPAFGR